MERKLLITVGDDPDCLYGVRFVSSFFRNRRDMRLTLLHVAPHFESMDVKESLRTHEMDRLLSELYAKKGQEALETSTQILLNDDFSKQQISTKLVRRHHGMIRDMVEEARVGGHHAVILGRRGYSIFEKVLHPWLSEASMDMEIDLPLWVCRHPVRGLKHVLVCVDGSDSALRAVDHVAFMAGREDQHRITLFHVNDGKGPGADLLLDAARQRLLDGGVGLARIETLVEETVEGAGVSGLIQERASRGAFAVVAVGRRGTRNDREVSAGYMGSKSLDLLRTLEKSTLWVSH